MPVETPIGGMSNEEACRALGPALARMREVETKLPKTTNAAANVDPTTIRALARESIITQYNVVKLVEHICQTSEDPALVRINLELE
jgi:hypothetical protein